MRSLIFWCDGCGKEFRYEKMMVGGNYRELKNIQPLKTVGKKEYCRGCLSKVEAALEKVV